MKLEKDVEKRFDKEFGEKAQETSNLDLHDYYSFIHEEIKQFIAQEIQTAVQKERSKYIQGLPKHCWGCKHGGDKRCTGLRYPDLLAEITTKDTKDVV